MIGRCGERGSVISVPVARHDDDDELYERPFINSKYYDQSDTYVGNWKT